ncbi:MAG: Topoisomerase IA (Type III) [Promethearchaeota archaeon]|nr:MAG: Topoisomerase IA (Type III) [Candidatus Lokiarchaeota archaeon]
MVTLIIAEKKKAAQAIAESLGSIKTIKEAKSLEIYHIPQKDIYVLPLRGHILEHRNSEQYKSWTKSVPREIITNPRAIDKQPKPYASPYIKALKKYGKKCQKCIIGTDADIEGCNIGIFDALPFIKQVNHTINVSQLWLSSLQKQEIITKFNNQIQPKWSWADSGEARALIDAIIGFSATREVTNTLKPLLTKISRKFVSIGRVQTSLLYLLYLRDKEIKNFTPVPYFTIDGFFSYQQHQLKGYHIANPFKQNEFQRAQSIYEKIKHENFANIIDNSKQSNILYPPTPLNTSKALMLLTKILHISANTALKVMNDLYLNKIISYPRTESDVYKSNFNHQGILQKFNAHSSYGGYVSHIIKKGFFQPTKGKKDAEDHPPITPLESLELTSTKLKNNLQVQVYNLLSRHYLALFGENAVESKIKLKLSVKEEIFNSSLVSLVYEGFLQIAPFLKKTYDPLLRITAETLGIDKIELNRKETKPPAYYTDTSLLRLMEKNNLGTKSTRPVIIQTLEQRGLIEKQKRHYDITKLGIFLIENLIKVWLPFLKPKFTQMIEVLLNEIKEKKKSKDVVIKEMREIFLKLFDKFLANKKILEAKITSLDTTKFQSTNSNSTNITSADCPHCHQAKMKLITPPSKKKFLVCLNEQCQTKYLNVPNKGRLYILKNSFCSKCGFNVFKVYISKKNKSFTYYMCPNCWNKGYKENISRKGFCSQCKEYEIQKNKCVKKNPQ